MTITCECGVQATKMAVDDALNSGRSLYCKGCGHEVEITADAAITRMARDVQTIRKIAVGFAWLAGIGVVLAILAWLLR